MNYSINQVAKLAGVSVRTLHYYDEINLLKPSYVADNKYRFYTDTELDRLQQILFFRELDFSLFKIKEIMQSNNYQELEALKDQFELLKLKRDRLNNLIETISKTIKSKKGGEYMNNDDKYSAFNDPSYADNKQEIEDKWGKTVVYQQSQERVAKMSKADMEKIGKEAEAIYLKIIELKNISKPVDDSMVQEQIGLLYKHLHNFYDPTLEMFEGLGEMYVVDHRFRDFYESRDEGLGEYMRDAMKYFAKQSNHNV